jgi:hypothetical protein
MAVVRSAGWFGRIHDVSQGITDLAYPTAEIAESELLKIIFLFHYPDF